MKHTTRSAIGANMVQEVGVKWLGKLPNSSQLVGAKLGGLNKAHKAIILEAQQKEVNRVSDNIDFRNLRKSGALRR